MIRILIRRMTATFGKLHGETLELKPGLNILQAPNETGKSTWCAFLAAMFYGMNSRERDRAGYIADKNRFAPWSGMAMSGRMDCLAGEDELTLIRSTRRQTAPMGTFQAVYAGTGNAVPGLTGQNCGESLLGISKEVFERSCFIRQNGISISQDAGLERRIAALLTSGEEDTSYSEAADALKKQLNCRRHGRTGQLPALEAELAETRRRLEELASIERQLQEARALAETLSRQETELTEELFQCAHWESARQQRALQEAEEEAVRMSDRVNALRRQMEHIPSNDAIGRLRGAIVNLQTARKAAEKAGKARDEAGQTLQGLEDMLKRSPFAGQTAEGAREAAAIQNMDISWNIWPSLYVNIAGLLAAVLAGYCAGKAFGAFVWHPAAAVALFLAITALSAVMAHRMRLQAKREAQALALKKRFGTANRSAIATMAEEYCKLLEAREAALSDWNAKSSSADALYQTFSTNEESILQEVRRFAPSVSDLSTADQALRTCAIRRKELHEAEAAAREAQARRDALAASAPPETDVPAAVPPARSKNAVQEDLEQVRAALAAARSTADHLTGQLHVLGDPVALRSGAAHLEERISRLEDEYSAIAMAIESLECANTILQNRFSPALGRRAAEIFSELTEGRYSGVTLDRSFQLSAEPAGDAACHDAAFLSAGAVDQLYLATRLAICQLVLPAENAIPIILDDALASFDDQRCTAALRWLKRQSETRQILLFTCHSREAAFFAEDGAVHIQRLETKQ